MTDIDHHYNYRKHTIATAYDAMDRGVLLSMIERSDVDVTTCIICGQPVLALPDGLAMCRICEEREQ